MACVRGGWRTALRRNGLARLHTSDFLSGQAEFAGLGWSYDRRVEVLQEFIDIIRRYIQCGISVGVDAQVYKEVLAGQRKKPSAEGFAFERIVHLCRKVLEPLPDGLPFHLVFDDCEEHSMKFYGQLRDLKARRPAIRAGVAGISFCNDNVIPQLQAADLLACATLREFPLGAQKAWSEGPFAGLLRDLDGEPLPYYSEYWDADELRTRQAELIVALSNTRGPLNPAAKA